MELGSQYGTIAYEGLSTKISNLTTVGHNIPFLFVSVSFSATTLKIVVVSFKDLILRIGLILFVILACINPNRYKF